MQRFRIALAATLVAWSWIAVAEEAPVELDAFAVLRATGTVLATGSETHVFAGTMRGPYFVDVGQGPVPAGEIACAGLIQADEVTGQQTGSAHCRLRAVDGAVSYGEFTCDGFRLIGCNGRFKLTGGEGRMEGAHGEGSITLRRYETELLSETLGVVEEAALGIAFWKDFRVTVPEPAQ
ncbi:MAG: hypothetical protein EA406_13180 [Rhodospirillales bacterium]|nr:MAG: hypothetical protein EA406_13180 [Rhodospirillales bacterium]